MDVAGVSTSLSQMKLAQNIGISMLKMAMDTVSNNGGELVQMMQENTKMLEQSVTPHLGASIDIRI